MKTSLKDIAKKLNLSMTTVSWVLSGKGDQKSISPATQSRVIKCAKELNYQPNLLARGLNTGVSGTIGLIIPSISDLFYSSIAKEIEVEAGQLGYSLMICSSESELERESRMIKMLKSKQADGIILAPTKRSRSEIDQMLKESYPFVLFDRFFSQIDTNYVIIDNEQSSYSLVKHLIDQGKRKIAIITTNPHLETLQMRNKGYQRALEESGLVVDERLYGFAEYIGYERNVRVVLDRIFKEVPDVDGFFFTTHILAVETFCYLNDNFIDISRFGLCCIHEEVMFKIVAPNINVARMPIDDIGKNTVRILHDNIIYNLRSSSAPYRFSKMILPCSLKLK